MSPCWLSAFNKYEDHLVHHENEVYKALMKIKCITGKEGAIYFGLSCGHEDRSFPREPHRGTFQLQMWNECSF